MSAAAPTKCRSCIRRAPGCQKTPSISTLPCQSLVMRHRHQFGVAPTHPRVVASTSSGRHRVRSTGRYRAVIRFPFFIGAVRVSACAGSSVPVDRAPATLAPIVSTGPVDLVGTVLACLKDLLDHGAKSRALALELRADPLEGMLLPATGSIPGACCGAQGPGSVRGWGRATAGSDASASSRAASAGCAGRGT
jgi:hypothetical protein